MGKIILKEKTNVSTAKGRSKHFSPARNPCQVQTQPTLFSNIRPTIQMRMGEQEIKPPPSIKSNTFELSNAENLSIQCETPGMVQGMAVFTTGWGSCANKRYTTSLTHNLNRCLTYVFHLFDILFVHSNNLFLIMKTLH